MFGREWLFFEVFKTRGARATLSHLCSRMFGDARYLRPASTTDFRRHKLAIHKNLEDFISAILTDLRVESTSSFTLRTFETHEIPHYEYPAHWNSGEDLRRFLFNMTLALDCACVVETGTANGASAAAICAAMQEKRYGSLYSFDIDVEHAQLVEGNAREHFNFIQVDGSSKTLDEKIDALEGLGNKGIFLHDSDHTYFGQWSDYSIAAKHGFNLLVSDDVDASLAFTDFAGSKGHIYLDGSKFIGAMVLKYV